MPRKGPAPKRPLVSDPVYGSPLVTQLINKVLVDGKKSTAERIVYGALEGARAKSGGDPVAALKKAMDNVKPSLEVRSRRVGGATYQVPVEVKPGRGPGVAFGVGLGVRRRRVCVGGVRGVLPAVVCEGLVGLGHLVGVFATLDSGTETVRGIQDFVLEALGHGLLAAGLGVAHEPTQGEGGGATRLDLNRNLVGGATNTA
jgi:small subunit ribosomal protein S7